MEIHTIPPVYDENSRILILGSFPSVKSRETGFFYGHPRNRFWKVLAAVTELDCPNTIEGKKSFLINNHIAVWDVIQSCDIENSADSSIRNVKPNDLTPILEKADILRIFTNGAEAYKLFTVYNPDKTAIKLPSTSPANAAYSLERLVDEWKVLRNFT